MTIVGCHNDYDDENDYDNEGRILQLTMQFVYHHDIRHWIKVALIGGLAQDSSNSIALAMELLQSRTIYRYVIIYKVVETITLHLKCLLSIAPAMLIRSRRYSLLSHLSRWVRHLPPLSVR